MIKRLLSMLLSLTVILSLVPPITAAAADEDTGVMTAVSTTVEISEDEAFLWDSTTDRKTLAGINPEWYKANVTNAGIQSITIKIPASTETIRKDFGGSYATIKGYSTAGTELIPAKLDCQQVLVDFSAATNLKTIERQAFFEVSGLTGVIDLSKTKVEVIEGTAFKKTAITGVILPTIKRLYEDNITGKLSDERFKIFCEDYESEQRSLREEVVALQKQFDDAENTCTNISSFLKMAKRYADFDELTPAMLRDLIEKIIVYEGDKSSGHREQRIEIYYTFIGAAESSQIIVKRKKKAA